MVFEHSDATSEKRVKGCAGSGIKLLIPDHPLTIQNLLIKFKKFLALNCSRNIQMKPFSTMILIRVTGCQRTTLFYYEVD